MFVSDSLILLQKDRFSLKFSLLERYLRKSLIIILLEKVKGGIYTVF
jgi:hypothetical protein